MAKKKRYGEISPFQKIDWALARAWSRQRLWGNHIEIEKYGKIEGPAIVVANHQSFYDWAFASRCFGNIPMFVVMARYFFYPKWKDNALRSAGCIPKSVFDRDAESAIAVMRALKGGNVLLLFPEAHLGILNKMECLPTATARFIKKLGLPVYGMHISGLSILYPKWGTKHTGGKVKITSCKLFEPETLKERSVEEIHSALYEYLDYDDFDCLREDPTLSIRGKGHAEHLEYAIGFCPSCGKPETLTSRGNTLFCSECGYTGVVSDRYMLEGRSVQSWIAETILKVEFPYTGKVTLAMKGEEVDRGKCVLSDEGLFFLGEHQQLHFPLDILSLLPFSAGRNFVVYRKGVCYTFLPEQKGDAVKFAYGCARLTNTISQADLEAVRNAR